MEGMSLPGFAPIRILRVVKNGGKSPAGAEVLASMLSKRGDFKSGGDSMVKPLKALGS
jgi:hypothetical protein